LEGWKRRIIILKEKFIDINFYHILRDFNRVADDQSKKALTEPEGNIVLHKWIDGREITSNIINIY